jgi:hypothetical protein
MFSGFFGDFCICESVVVELEDEVLEGGLEGREGPDGGAGPVGVEFSFDWVDGWSEEASGFLEGDSEASSLVGGVVVWA